LPGSLFVLLTNPLICEKLLLMLKKDLAKFVKPLSSNPGVYIFRNKAGKVLYVGKAVKLKERVKSYADPKERGPKILRMMQQASTVKVEETDSEIEAIILEANIIRKLKPPYNTLGKDDKSANYIKITWSEEYPRVQLLRGRVIESGQDKKTNEKSKKQDKIFGPYVAIGMCDVLRIIRKIWPHRDCGQSKFNSYKKLRRGCLFAQIGLCDAPCIENISAKEYRQQIKQIVDFLSGKKVKVIEAMKRDMEAAAMLERYEKAAKLRDRVSALEHLKEFVGRGILRGFEENKEKIRQGIKVEAYDISNMQGDYAVGVMVSASIISQEDKIMPADVVFTKENYKKFKIKTVKGTNDVAMLDEVLRRRFSRARVSRAAALGAERGMGEWELPDLIILDGGEGQLSRVRATAKGMGIKVPIIAVSKGQTRKRVDLHMRAQDKIKIKYSNRQLKKIALTMREEAHRFAISYYRKTHRRSLRSSF